MICSKDLVKEELKFIKSSLLNNGYPERFIEKNLVEKPTMPKPSTVKKKELFLQLPFKGDTSGDILRRRLEKAITRTFPAATLRLIAQQIARTQLETTDRQHNVHYDSWSLGTPYPIRADGVATLYEMKVKTPSDELNKTTSDEPELYFGMDPACDQLTIASKEKTPLEAKMLGCKSEILEDKTTNMKIFFDAKSLVADNKCKIDKLNLFLEEWKTVVAGYLKVNSDQIDLKLRSEKFKVKEEPEDSTISDAEDQDSEDEFDEDDVGTEVSTRKVCEKQMQVDGDQPLVISPIAMTPSGHWTTCLITVTTQPDKTWELAFTDLSKLINEGSGCATNYVQISEERESLDASSKYCATVAPRVFTSTSNSLFLRYNMASQISDGFTALVKTICEKQMQVDGDQPLVISPIAMTPSGHWKTCLITVTTQPAKTWKLAFTDLTKLTTDRMDCDNNYVQFSVDEDTLLSSKKYCAGVIPEVFTYTSNRLFLRYEITQPTANGFAALVGNSESNMPLTSTTETKHA
ncbi:unnamed protein product [Echinostoma caproni]|uniref:Death domain-containing protein n=1 Tax=Echinostoma caproni TaxID=27848 RepID=A0A183AA58_9TREM|nr:unnamed protein product [Echinostoma caproni]